MCGVQSCEHEIQNMVIWDRNMTQQLRSLAALAEDQGLLPSTHMAAHRRL